MSRFAHLEDVQRQPGSSSSDQRTMTFWICLFNAEEFLQLWQSLGNPKLNGHTGGNCRSESWAPSIGALLTE